MLTHKRLRELFSYDPETGKFIRTDSQREAGWVDERGYRRIQIDGITYRAHRLAWFLAHDTWPDQIDHINLRTLDNRLGNLRPATHSQNAANRTRVTHRPKGVYPRSNGRWGARIKHMKRYQALGTFDTIEEAHRAYSDRAREIFGEFARAD
jgi:hypothetical protein